LIIYKDIIKNFNNHKKMPEEPAPFYLNELIAQRIANHAAKTVPPAAKNQNEAKKLPPNISQLEKKLMHLSNDNDAKKYIEQHQKSQAAAQPVSKSTLPEKDVHQWQRATPKKM
jgi:hypothetical protein